MRYHQEMKNLRKIGRKYIFMAKISRKWNSFFMIFKNEKRSLFQSKSDNLN